jgi:hypothetical protein
MALSPDAGRNRRRLRVGCPEVPADTALCRVDHLFTQAPDEAWEKRSCGDGAKGPRVCHWAADQLPVIEDFDGERPTHHRWAMARRSISGPDEIAYYLAYAPLQVTVRQGRR